MAHQNEQKEWTIFELVQVLGRQSGIGFVQNPVTLRRKKSWVAVEPSLQLESIEPEETGKIFMVTCSF